MQGWSLADGGLVPDDVSFDVLPMMTFHYYGKLLILDILTTDSMTAAVHTGPCLSLSSTFESVTAVVHTGPESGARTNTVAADHRVQWVWQVQSAACDLRQARTPGYDLRFTTCCEGPHCGVK